MRFGETPPKPTHFEKTELEGEITYSPNKADNGLHIGLSGPLGKFAFLVGVKTIGLQHSFETEICGYKVTIYLTLKADNAKAFLKLLQAMYGNSSAPIAIGYSGGAFGGPTGMVGGGIAYTGGGSATFWTAQMK